MSNTKRKNCFACGKPSYGYMCKACYLRRQLGDKTHIKEKRKIITHYALKC